MEKNIGEATVNSCPFCGSADVEYEAESTFNSPYVWCRGCDKKFNFIQLSDWNTRPIEDALTQRVKVLEEALGKIAESDHARENCNCYYGDNGYTCGGEIAKEALAPPVGEGK